MAEKFEGRQQNQNEYDEDGEVILDEETRGLYQGLENKSRSIKSTIKLVMNRADKLNPDDRKKLVKELNDDLDALLAKVVDAAEDE
ncbi:hypothetical protein MYX07_06035 [Patescibacteria group bacterium AH-259-L07]|nr:hypothetical protein [Patescibacteria group bacterium AH-259-L07]